MVSESSLWRWVLVALLASLCAACGTSTRLAYTNVRLDEERTVLADSDGSAAYLPGDPDEAAAAARWWLATRQLSLAPRRWDRAAPCNAPHKSKPEVLVMLALSGGGHRAAYFSALAIDALRHLQDASGRQVDVMREVDLISAVSGGTLPAAYYVASQDEGTPDCTAPSGRVWSRDEVAELMTHDYLRVWIGRWFLPHNIARFWTTGYDRTDIMAGVFADSMFSDTRGRPITLDRLNPSRPNLVINATVGSRAEPEEDNQFGSVLTFTHEDFRDRGGSDIGAYELARAVMASSTFPGVFSFMTLRDFRVPEPGTPRYIHVFDGGNSDNLGLTSIKRVLFGPDGDYRPLKDYRKVIVLQVDAFVDSTGADPSRPDPRGFWDYLFDSNVVDATDSLLEENRDRLLREFKRRTFQPYEPSPDFGDADAPPEQSRARDCRKDGMPDEICQQTERWWNDLNAMLKDKLLYVHIDFQAVRDRDLQRQLRSISTVGLRKAGEKGAPISDKEALGRGVAAIFDPAACPAGPRRELSICHCWDAVSAVLADPSLSLNRFQVSGTDRFNYFCPLGERTLTGQQAY